MKSAKDLHDQAEAEGNNFYVDPDTGYQVMTEHYLRERGWCCGSDCRHCPY